MLLMDRISLSFRLRKILKSIRLFFINNSTISLFFALMSGYIVSMLVWLIIFVPIAITSENVWENLQGVVLYSFRAWTLIYDFFDVRGNGSFAIIYIPPVVGLVFLLREWIKARNNKMIRYRIAKKISLLSGICFSVLYIPIVIVFLALFDLPLDVIIKLSTIIKSYFF